MPGFNGPLQIVAEPTTTGVHWNDQLVVPVAWLQVVPPSVDISTPATTPPPASDAVPLMVTGVPAEIEAPAVGLEIVDVGVVVSADALAGVRPDCPPATVPPDGNR